MNIFMKPNKETTKLPMTGKVKKGFRIYCTAIMGAALVLLLLAIPLPLSTTCPPLSSV